MRRALALVALLASGSQRALADDPPRVTLEVGEVYPTGGYAGLCDDTKVATIDAGTDAKIKALRPGKTLCSWAVANLGGVRQVVEVVVTEPRDSARADGVGRL